MIKTGSVSFNGKRPEIYYEEQLQALVNLLNHTATKLESDLVSSTPFNTGRLKGGWVMTPAKPGNLVAVVGQSLNYFLPVEMGRAPGKGISLQGQADVALWAKRKLGMGEKEAKGLAFRLSQKYKAQGRPAEGFLGLAKKGTVPAPGVKIPDNPVTGSLLYKAFQDLKSGLRNI